MGKRLIIKGANFAANAINGSTPSVTYYSVTYSLSNCIASNNATSVAEGSSFTVTITPQSGYAISSVIVTHNGMTVSPTGSGYTYSVSSVRGDIIITAVAEVEVAPSVYTDKLVQGYWTLPSLTVNGKLLASTETGFTSANVYHFVATTKDGNCTALGFSDGEITITIPANCHYRGVMMKADDGSAGGNIDSDMARTEQQTNTRTIKVNSKSIPEILGESSSTYPYWGVNIEKSDSSDSTVADMIALGVSVEKTSSNVVLGKGFWANHTIIKSSSNAANFVNASYDGGLIPFSAGEYQITIPQGQYRIVLSSTVDGATGSMCRTNVLFVSSGTTTISSNDLLSIMAANAASATSSLQMDAYNSSTTYLAWSIHYSKSTTSTASATSPLYAVNAGLTIEKV